VVVVVVAWLLLDQWLTVRDYPPPQPRPEYVPCVDDGYGNGVAEVEPGVWVDCMHDQHVDAP
jgi:hypothetical protein